MFNKNSILKPSKLRKRRRKIIAIKIVIVTLFFFSFIFFLSWCSKISTIQIENIEIFGNSTLSKDDIIQTIKSKTTEKYFFLFSKNNPFLYPKRELEKKLAYDFKKIDSVSIKSRGLKKLAVNIVERKPNSIWCHSYLKNGDIIENKNSEKCYFLDKEGVIFTEAPDFSGDSFIRYYGQFDDDVDIIGKIYLQDGKFKEISRFIHSLETLGIATASFRIISENDYEINLKNGIKLFLNDKKHFDEILENVQLISSEVNLKNDNQGNNSPKIDYVDLRFGNKVYLKGE